jgi:hypothetical protein
MVESTILKRRCIGWLAASLLIASCGCAAAYHDYPCGCVPYGYCPSAPLRYAAYDACLTPVAACYVEKSKGPQGRSGDLLGEYSQ